MRIRICVLVITALLMLPTVGLCLTLDDVIKLKELGIGEAVIIQKVKTSGVSFVLGDADLTRLKKAGASEKLIQSMRAIKTTQTPVRNVMFVFDCSGSMREKTQDGKEKIVVARQAFADLANKLSSDLRVGVVAFGHKSAPTKNGIEVIRKLQPVDKAELVLSVAKLTPRGKTPIAASLVVAAGQLLKNKDSGSIVLISDGKETGGGNPVETAAMLRKKFGIKFGIHVVGFSVTDEERKQLEAIATAGAGKYFHAKNAKDLGEKFAQVAREISAPAAPPVLQPKAFFMDNFDRDDLGADYEIKNENQDAYLPGEPKGHLLILTKSGSMRGARKEKEKDVHKGITNLIVLKKDMPAGDWRVTVRLRTKITSYNQGAGFLLYKDNDNWLSVMYWCPRWDGWSGYLRQCEFEKELRGQTKALAGHKRDRLRDLSKAKPETVELRLEKRGRKYQAFCKYEGHHKDFVSLGTHTVLRIAGKIALAAYNADPKANEIAAEYDWVKIEVLE